MVPHGIPNLLFQRLFHQECDAQRTLRYLPVPRPMTTRAVFNHAYPFLEFLVGRMPLLSLDSAPVLDHTL
jgi:hypothetical protein